MRSKVAEQLRQEQRERFAAMSPSERVGMAERLGREWLADFTSANASTRQAALKVLRRSRRAGRRPSASMDGRDDS
jgi:hypothetical protein